MSYEPTNWKAGDVVTSAKLNKLEQGVANAGGGDIVVLTANTETGGIGKSYNDLLAYYNAGKIVRLKREYDSSGNTVKQFCDLGALVHYPADQSAPDEYPEGWGATFAACDSNSDKVTTILAIGASTTEELKLINLN